MNSAEAEVSGAVDEVELGDEYRDKTCGLCGDFNGHPQLNEFKLRGKTISLLKFVSKYQVDDPSETCHPLNPAKSEENYINYVPDCSCMLNKVAPLCKLPKTNYVTECQRDLYKCTIKGDTQCSCQTLSEYSRQCSRLLEPVTNWRNISFCPPIPCPGNQVYQECGSPCLSTCSNPQTTCDSYGTYGCFCPEGTVLDDISAKDMCVPLSRCPCVLNGQVYAPGGSVNSPCKICKCFLGKWNCNNLPCPGRCSIEGGSFVTTFDSKQYRFHGACTYLLVKSVKMLGDGTIEAVFDKCGVRYSETQLTSIIYATNQTKIIISMQDTVEVNNKIMKLPYEDGNIAIYRQSSSYIQVKSNFGLEMQVQTHPFLQLYIIVDESFATTTHGLCGNFDSVSQNDFRSSMGIQEGTASSFVDSWRVIERCQSAQDKDCDPCSLSQSNIKSGAKTYDDFTKIPEEHYSPKPLIIAEWFHRRNQVDDESIPQFVAALKRLAQICGFHESLEDRFQDCLKYKKHLVPHITHILSNYDDQTAKHEWESDDQLSNSEAGEEAVTSKVQLPKVGTVVSFIPKGTISLLSVEQKWNTMGHIIKACWAKPTSPEKNVQKKNLGTFKKKNKLHSTKRTYNMEENNLYCEEGNVQKYDGELQLNALSIQDESHIFCEIPNLSRCKFETCNYEKSQDFMCNSLGVYARACAIKGLILTDWRNFVNQCKISCHGLKVFSYDSKACNHTCFSLSNPVLECTENGVPVDGCNCPPDTFLDDTNTCVSASSCPCFLQSGPIIPAGKRVIIFDQMCICIRGKWECTGDAKCPSTCIIHGEGHITTFDGRQYVFDGNCEYTLVQDACSVNYRQPSFKIVSENIICGKTGVVCTKSIKVYFKDTLIKLTDGHYQITPPNAARRLKVVSNPLYLKFDLRINEKFELTIIWNKNMNAYISITRLSEFTVCGLCGNYNGNVDDEYITQNKYLVSNVLAFANSWKEDPTCRDVTEVVFPCHKNPYRLARAEKMCAIINSKTFEPCHKLVYRMPYYDNCVRDACGCELVGDCECLCDAVAVYAKACIDAGVCIDWRTPEFCRK
ncbi:mucin-6-like [Mustelus asterias]